MANNETMRPDQIVLLDGTLDKPRLLRDLADRAARALGLDGPKLAAALTRREDLGSTGLGAGIAIPHTRLAEVQKPFAILAILQKPIQFDAIDDKPVDIVLLLIAPDNGDALKALAGISRVLREPTILERLRRAPSAQAAYDTLDP
ncbi:MAG: PTS sugar transporter subunit IIA [Devosia sp.]